jgi:hypothetical protein
MTITSGNNNAIIVKALEQNLSYAEKHLCMFIGQSVRCHASIIGLHRTLVIPIDNLHKHAVNCSRKTPKATSVHILEEALQFQNNRVVQECISQCRKPISPIPRDCQVESRSEIVPVYNHPERIFQIQKSNTGSCNYKLRLLDSILNDNVRAMQKFKKERWNFYLKDKPAVLHQTGSSKVAVNTLIKKQRTQLWAISTDALSTYINNRV